MFEEIQERLKKIKKRVEAVIDTVEVDRKEREVSEIDDMLLKPDAWAKAGIQDTIKRQAALKGQIQMIRDIEAMIEETEVLLGLAVEASDEETSREVEERLEKIKETVCRLEMQRMLGGENDRLNAIVSIHPGAGGLEAQDWAEMLLRMYLRWSEMHGCKTEIVDFQPGEGAGVKSVTFTVTGEYAYGYLKAEAGVHRLVRISPFDANQRRHTSFSSVFVYPEIEEDIEIEINEDELKIDTFRSGGAGGQHVNKTDSAVRITHIPSGIVVQCQNERSQHKNKHTAMKILRSRLYELRMKEQHDRLKEFSKDKKEIAWGNQIRSYVMQPYRMVKDHRTSTESGNVDAVLNGHLDKFIESYLLSTRD